MATAVEGLIVWSAGRLHRQPVRGGAELQRWNASTRSQPLLQRGPGAGGQSTRPRKAHLNGEAFNEPEQAVCLKKKPQLIMEI